MPHVTGAVPWRPRRSRGHPRDSQPDLNATAAAQRAGYSARSANKLGPRLLGDPDVAAAIAAAVEDRSRRTGITADRVVEEYARIAFADIRRVISWSSSGVVTVKPSADLTDAEAAMIAEVQDVATANGRTIRVKLGDKLGALDALARHLGMFIQKHEHSGPGGRPIPVGEGTTIIVTGDEAEYVAALKAIREKDRAAAANGGGLPIGTLLAPDR